MTSVFVRVQVEHDVATAALMAELAEQQKLARTTREELKKTKMARSCTL